MKKTFLIIALLFLMTSAVFSQQLVVKDTLKTLDSVATVTVAGYEEIYVDIYNSSADSTALVTFFGINYTGTEIPLGVVDQISSYNYSTVTSVTTAAASKKTYKVLSNGYNQLKIVLGKYNGAAFKIFYELRGIRKTQF